MLEAFHVKYRGLYGGGNAIVLAPSALKALDLVDKWRAVAICAI